MSKKLMYHTQGYKLPYLTSPIKCTREDAWLGEGYYYWYEEIDATAWGQNAKRRYHKFVVYESEIELDLVLDTVFNIEHYFFWCKMIDKIADSILKTTSRKATIKEINSMINKRNAWKDVKGIVFQDIPTNQDNNKVTGLFYRKRIQIAVFDPEIILTFAFSFELDC